MMGSTHGSASQKPPPSVLPLPRREAGGAVGQSCPGWACELCPEAGHRPGRLWEPSSPGSISLHFLSGLQGVPWGESRLSLPRENTPNQTDFPQPAKPGWLRRERAARVSGSPFPGSGTCFLSCLGPAGLASHRLLPHLWDERDAPLTDGRGRLPRPWDLTCHSGKRPLTLAFCNLDRERHPPQTPAPPSTRASVPLL